MTASVLATPCALGAEVGGDPVPRRAGHDDLGHDQSFHGAQTSLCAAIQHRVFCPVDEPGVLRLFVNIDASREYVGYGDRFGQGNSSPHRIKFNDCHDGPKVTQPCKGKPVGGHAATRKLSYFQTSNPSPSLCLTGGHLRCCANLHRRQRFFSCAASPRPAQTACGVGPASGSARPLFQSLLASNANCGTSARPLWRTALHRVAQYAGKGNLRFHFMRRACGGGRSRGGLRDLPPPTPRDAGTSGAVRG
jgi:hypothetical protein